MAELTWNRLIQSVDDKTVEIAIEAIGIDQDGLPPDLGTAYHHDGVTLVLGAGVSKSCGIPLWPELLLRLHALSLAVLEPTNIDDLASAFLDAIAGEGPLVSARMAAANLGDEKLAEHVRQVLYARDPQPSDLLQVLAKLANACEGEARVRSILTYNYDTLLEDELSRIGRDFDRKDRQDRGSGRGLPVRHVHGFLAREAIEGEWIVLTERQYHLEYATPYTWSNVVQLNAFRETTCLFIGLSMSDPNLRRLLESSRATATPRHFAFLRRTAPEALRESIAASWEQRGRGMGRPKGSERRQVDRRLQLLCDLADMNRADALRELGVDVVWYSSHAALPALIGGIRTT
jgi:hypothetical protein